MLQLVNCSSGDRRRAVVAGRRHPPRQQQQRRQRRRGGRRPLRDPQGRAQVGVRSRHRILLQRKQY